MLGPKELLRHLLNLASEKKYPDIHLNANHKPIVRNESGEITTIMELGGEKVYTLNNEVIDAIIKIMVSDGQYHIFKTEYELDTSYSFKHDHKEGEDDESFMDEVREEGIDDESLKDFMTEEALKEFEEENETLHASKRDRYRVNCYIDSNGFNIAMRLIPKTIPTMEELGLGEQIKAMCNKSKGLILVTGPTGSGKSTNLAAMINYINENQKKHILTIEDPIEFSYKSESSLVNQREVGSHTKGFSAAIRSALREDPDVIMLGEMRDPETIKAALTLAETGHLVLSTLHTNDSVQTIDRIVDIFPSAQQKQIRMQLAMGLVGVISQRLVPRTDGGRVAAREILIANDAVRNLIITAKTHQLYSVLEVGQQSGMILMDKYLVALYKKQLISKETLMSFVRDKDNVEMMIGE